MSWQARLHLNKCVKFYSLFLGNLELGRMHINIRFFAPVKLRNGDYSFKYSFLRPGTFQKRGLLIQIFAFSPRHISEAGTISFKYSLSRPGTFQKRGLFIQIFSFSPQWGSEAGLIHSNICFLAPAQSRSGLNTFTDRHIQIHIKQITRSEILRNIVE